ncbi:hypothetical protein D8674_020707 [Pyrus ussuriensis x Pyrus communis]|uniref:Uncharacterized protein n=1 Tax=Pyrus ussuriensis x Pyrus communis TaxID=2448454 RepID=A0A5N5HGF1_9ROSA|nr:hypothetical protein D8674_020707 [Pyrus ussuriensis x Pyrus communis]
MHNSNQDSQDQRSMEDSSAMTIEFLRARLLSERSVSRSARQRVNELEKMVEELEEQLKIVSLQRKMAEKATADVLAILENQGASDISEEFDSSSDQETHQGSKVGNNLTNEEESFEILTARRNDQEELSGSDADSSRIPGRSLSWKGRIESPHSQDKYKDLSTRRRGNFTSVGSSSPRHHLGKSCRQIKHKETRSDKFDSQENGVSASSEGLPNGLYGGPEKLRESSEFPEGKTLSNGVLSGTIEKQRNRDLDFSGHGRDIDMEKALEHQAQLICQNEEMEKAQREWEEKFRENNTSTPDSCDPGNHSDITEERDEIKAQMPSPARVTAAQAQESKSAEGDVCLPKETVKIQSNGFLLASHIDMGGLQDNPSRSSVASSQVQEFAFPTANGKQNQESAENYAQQTSRGSHTDQLLHQSAHKHTSDATSSDAGYGFHKGNASGSRNDLYALVPHDSQDKLGGVLDALKQARLSLQQTMTRLPLVDGTSAHKSIEPSIPATKTVDRVEIPVGCAGLFRLPTDFAVEEAVAHNSYFGSSGLPSARHFPENRVSVTPDAFVTSPYVETRPTFSTNAADRFSTSQYIEPRPTFSTSAADRFVTSQYIELRPTFSTAGADRSAINPYVETRPNFPTTAAVIFPSSPNVDTRSNFSADNRFITGRYADSGSRVSPPLPHIDPYFDMGIPSSRLTNPPYSNYPSVPDPTPWMTSDEALTRALPRRPVGAPTDRYSYYDHTRPNMYR